MLWWGHNEKNETFTPSSRRKEKNEEIWQYRNCKRDVYKNPNKVNKY